MLTSLPIGVLFSGTFIQGWCMPVTRLHYSKMFLLLSTRETSVWDDDVVAHFYKDLNDLYVEIMKLQGKINFYFCISLKKKFSHLIPQCAIFILYM